MFDKKLIEKNAKEILLLAKNRTSAIKIVEEIIIPTLGSEGDIEFWNQIKVEILSLIVNEKID
jgi:hypothetical protein